MTIGIDVSTRDRTFTWADLPPKHYPQCMLDYYSALQESQEMEREYTRKIDGWIANGQYDEMEEFWEKCKRMNIHVLSLHRRMNDELYPS